MRSLSVLLFILAGIAMVHSQSTPLKVIVWTGEKNCGRGTQNVSCDSLETPRGNVSVVNDRDNALSLAVSFYEDGDYIIAATHLKNNADEPLMFDSDNWGAAHLAKRENVNARSKPLRAETAVPTRDILRGIRSGVVGDASADAFMASITKAGEVREVRQPDGTRKRSLVIVDDKQAAADADGRSASRRELATTEQEKFRKNALTQKSVLPNSSARGLVYFRRVKKAAVVVFSFPIADSIYVFRLLRKS